MANTVTSNVIKLKDLRQERRSKTRQPFYDGEAQQIEVKFGERNYRTQLYDLSCEGMGIIAPSNMKGLDFQGQKIQVRFNTGRGKYIDGIVTHVAAVKHSGEFATKIGIKVLQAHATWKPRGQRIACPEFFKPTLSAPNPFKFGQVSRFEVANFSPNGVRLITSADNFYLVPGVQLDAEIHIPGFSTHSIKICCTNSNVDGDDRISLGFEYTADPSSSYLSDVSEYLLATNAAPSVAKLREYGFLVDTIEQALGFFYPRNEEEFESMLALRLVTAKADGRWPECDDVKVMLDKYDHHARHIICKIGDTIVGAARIVFNNGFKDNCEHSGYDIPIDQKYWDEGFVECSRVCTHPEYRGSDIFINLMRHIARIVTQSGYKHLLVNCVDELVPIYERVGANPMGIRFNTEYMQDRALNLLYINIEESHLGRGMKVGNWSIIAEPITNHLIDQGTLKPNMIKNLKLRLLNLFARSVVQPHYAKSRMKRAKSKKESTNVKTAEKKDTRHGVPKNEKAN